MCDTINMMPVRDMSWTENRAWTEIMESLIPTDTNQSGVNTKSNQTPNSKWFHNKENLGAVNLKLMNIFGKINCTAPVCCCVGIKINTTYLSPWKALVTLMIHVNLFLFKVKIPKLKWDWGQTQAELKCQSEFVYVQNSQHVNLKNNPFMRARQRHEQLCMIFMRVADNDRGSVECSYPVNSPCVLLSKYDLELWRQ